MERSQERQGPHMINSFPQLLRTETNTIPFMSVHQILLETDVLSCPCLQQFGDQMRTHWLFVWIPLLLEDKAEILISILPGQILFKTLVFLSTSIQALT